MTYLHGHIRTMSTKLIVNYSLNPPKESKVSDSCLTSKTHEYPLTREERSSHTIYYDQLRKVVLEAKAKIGEDLTSWRDAVGALEDKKESKKAETDEDDEEIEDGEGS